MSVPDQYSPIVPFESSPGATRAGRPARQTKKINVLTFGVFEGDFEPMRCRIEAQGIGFRRPLELEPSRFCFNDRIGLTVEVKVAEKTLPDAKVDFGGIDLSVFYCEKSLLPGPHSSDNRTDARPARLAASMTVTMD